MPNGWAVVLALLAVAAAQLGAMGVSLRAYDEGLMLYGAARVSHGGIPYHDFWSMYGPGSFYLLAGLDRVFGESVLTGRMLDAVSRAGVIVLLYVLLRRRAGRVGALAAASTAFLILAFDRNYLYPALPATALILLTLFALETALRRSDEAALPWAWAVAGAAAGSTFLLRPDFGLSAMAGCTWALLAPFPSKQSKQVERPRVGPAAAALLVGAAAVVAPLFGWLIAKGSASELYDNLVRIPMQVYVANRQLPFPRPLATLQAALDGHRPARIWQLAVYLPPLVALAGVTHAISRRLGGPTRWSIDAPEPEDRLFEASLVVLLLLCLKGSVRVEVLHMMPALFVAMAVIGLGYGRRRQGSDRVWRLVRIAIGVLAATGLAAGAARAQQMIRYGSLPPALLFADWPRCATAGNRLGCFRIDPERAAVLHFLGQHAKAGDLLYVGTGRHDKLAINNVELYFLSGLPAATKWADLHPGVGTTAKVQQAMIAEMEARPPAFVVRNTAWDDAEEPNASRLSSGVTLLDEYLRLRYVSVFATGTFSVSSPRGKSAS